jgi:hypothetical protein
MSDLLTRGHPAGGSGPVDIVHQWVSEQEFRIDVPYEFEVIDWSDTPGRWSGTLSVVETTISESSGRGTFDMGAHTLQETETIEMKVEVLNTISEYPMSALQASLTGRMEGRYSLLKTYASWQKKSCAQIANRPMNNTSRDRSGGSGQADATITVNVFDDGQYVIAAGADGFSIPITGEFSSELEVFRSGAHGCTVEMKTESRPHAPMSRAAGGLIQINGRVDPNNRNVLSGSTTENSGSGGEKRVKTTTWSFRRQ